MTKTKGTPGFPESLSHSSLSTFLDCEQEWKYAYLDRIVPKEGVRSPKMVEGIAFAKGLEVAQRLYHEKGIDEETAAALGLGALLKAYSVEAPDQDPHRGVYAYVDYLKRFPLATDYLQPAKFKGGRSGIEFNFAIPIESARNPSTKQPILFTGRCDMIAAWRGGHFVVDDKTTGSIGSGWAEGWELDGQILGYMWAATQHGIRILGGVVRAVSPRTDVTKFAEAIVYWSPQKGRAWEDWFHSVFKRVVTSYRQDAWTMDRGFQCKMGGGCPYRALCRCPDEHSRREALAALYVRRQSSEERQTNWQVGDSPVPSPPRRATRNG